MFLHLAYRLAVDNQRLRNRLAARDEQVDRLTSRLRRIQWDIELLSAAIPPERRATALALVRDRHRVEDMDNFEEADW